MIRICAQELVHFRSTLFSMHFALLCLTLLYNLHIAVPDALPPAREGVQFLRHEAGLLLIPGASPPPESAPPAPIRPPGQLLVPTAPTAATVFKFPFFYVMGDCRTIFPST